MKKTSLFDGSEIFIYDKCNCCDNIDYISKNLIKYNCWEPNISNLIINILKKKNNNIMFDIGTNIGYFSIISSKYCDKIYSFDANINNIYLLKKSIELNNINNIDALNYCIVSDENTFYKTSTIYEHNIGSMQVNQCVKEQSNIESLKLDNFILNNNITNIDVIKIDIEGSELECLNGLNYVLKTDIIKHIIIEVTPLWSVEKAIDILNILNNNNYRLYDAGLNELGEITENNIDLNNIEKNVINSINDFIHSVKIQTNILAIKNI
jgi:FkbM family methyltransferase